jgi:hypothetical protein
MFRTRAARSTLALLLTGACAAIPTGVAEAKAKPCVRKGSTTVERNAKVRVYEVGKTDRTLFACLLRNGKRLKVAEYTSVDASVSDEPRPTIWLNGEAVAANEFFCPPDSSPCTGDVASFDVRKRTQLYSESVPGGVVTQLALKPNASFAYIGGGTVRKADAAGSGELDAGPGIEEGSLARAGSIVYWTKAGQAFFARLQ